jgi:transcription antitermination factor NusG
MAGESLSPGDRVRIVDGNFKGFLGVLISEETAMLAGGVALPRIRIPDDQAIWVKLNIFGRDVTMKLPLDVVTRA